MRIVTYECASTVKKSSKTGVEFEVAYLHLFELFSCVQVYAWFNAVPFFVHFSLHGSVEGTHHSTSPCISIVLGILGRLEEEYKGFTSPFCIDTIFIPSAVSKALKTRCLCVLLSPKGKKYKSPAEGVMTSTTSFVAFSQNSTVR